MPFKTARLSFHGRPRRSLRCSGSGIRSSRISHCASVRSRVFATGIGPLQDTAVSRSILVLLFRNFKSSNELDLKKVHRRGVSVRDSRSHRRDPLAAAAEALLPVSSAQYPCALAEWQCFDVSTNLLPCGKKQPRETKFGLIAGCPAGHSAASLTSVQMLLMFE